MKQYAVYTGNKKVITVVALTDDLKEAIRINKEQNGIGVRDFYNEKWIDDNRG